MFEGCENGETTQNNDLTSVSEDKPGKNDSDEADEMNQEVESRDACRQQTWCLQNIHTSSGQWLVIHI